MYPKRKTENLCFDIDRLIDFSSKLIDILKHKILYLEKNKKIKLPQRQQLIIIAIFVLLFITIIKLDHKLDYGLYSIM